MPVITLGQTQVGRTGRPVDVSADGMPIYKVRGVTIDWTTVTAAAADLTLPDETPIKAGQKYLRYGQFISMIGTAEVQTITLTGGPTGGSFILTFPASGADGAQVAAALPYNATVDEITQALANLSRLGTNGIPVLVRAGSGTAGDPYVYTLTFNRALGNVPQFTSTNTFTGGTTPTVTHATVTAGTGVVGTSAGKFGPYDPAATDGRQTLARSTLFVLPRTVLEGDMNAENPAVYEGGVLWRERVIATTGSASLAAGPTFANVETNMPLVRWHGQV